MKALVLNLSHRQDRRDQFLRWNAHQELDFEFFEAVDGGKLDRKELVRQGLLAAGTDNWSNGAIGHALTSRKVWQRCVREDRPLLVLEDDVCLRGDFVFRVEKIMGGLQDNPHFIFLGYNTDAVVCFKGPEGLVNILSFDERVKKHKGFYEQLGRLKPQEGPGLFMCMQAWGMLACIVTPHGAGRLLEYCFPVRSSPGVPLFGKKRRVLPYSVDALINLALLGGTLTAWCCVPPLALGPNDHGTSNIIEK